MTTPAPRYALDLGAGDPVVLLHSGGMSSRPVAPPRRAPRAHPPRDRARPPGLGAEPPAATAVEVAGAGHMGPLTHADAVNDLLARHLAGAG
jgi:pimeloyl-ACP methyl ester carboxylesterase